MAAMLGRGGRLRAVVGLDCDNTSEEGLRALLALLPHAIAGHAEIWVRHNEAGLIFHPKVYAFRTATECAVYVGSNNLTEAGLFRNEELSGRLNGPLGGPLEQSFNAYIADLTDVGSGLALPLDDALVDDLVRLGYVAPEARLAGKTAARARRAARPNPLFSSRNVRPPRPPIGGYGNVDIEPGVVDAVEGWQRIFLRLRLARGTQSQIPLPVVRAVRRRLGMPALDGPVPVVLRNENREQEITPTYTGGDRVVPNTYKFEAFVALGEPLMKIEVIGGTVFVEKIDGAELIGQTIETYLLDGLISIPRETIQTKPVLEQATLYRFD